jgi:hypothetical protein
VSRLHAPQRTLPPALIRLFPQVWREHFGDEFEELLGQTAFSIHGLFDVAAAALDAHLNLDLPRRWSPMNERLRSSELAVFASWVVFVVAGLGFQKMTEDSPYHQALAVSPVIAVAFYGLVAAAFVALLAVLVGGTPIVGTIISTSISQRRWQPIALLAVPPFSLAVWLGGTLLLLQVHPGQALGWHIPLFLGWVCVFFIAAIASTLAVSGAAIRTDVDVRLYRIAVRPAAGTALAMAVAALAVVVWGIGMSVSHPDIFWGNGGVMATSTAASWLGIGLVMVGASTVASLNARAALRERSA